MKRLLLVAAALVSFLTVQAAEAGRVTRWMPGHGEWTDAARWSDGAPDALSRAAIHGQSEVRLPTMPQPAGVGGIAIGTLPGDQVRLTIPGGSLVCRRDFIHAGEADGSEADLVLDEGALQSVSAFYLDDLTYTFGQRSSKP